MNDRRRVYRLCRLASYVVLTYACCLVVIHVRAERLAHAWQSPAPPTEGLIGVVFFDDSPTMRLSRLAVAVRQLKDGRLTGLVMVGGWRPESGYLGSRIMVEEAIALGADRIRLLHDSASNDTWSNLDGALRIATQSGHVGLAFISDALHLSRIEVILWQRDYPYGYGMIVSPVRETAVNYWQRLNQELLGYLLLVVPRRVAEPMLRGLRGTVGQAPALRTPAHSRGPHA